MIERPQKYDFSEEKNQQLIKQRGISFEEVIAAIEENGILKVLPHPNQKKYLRQEVFVLNINNYVYLVPFVWQDENSIFLKTIFPSRKFTKKYLRSTEK